MDDWLRMTAADLGRGIGAGDIDPVDLTAWYLDAIREHPNADRIYARLTIDRAIAEAEASSARAKGGYRRSQLDGVPISWKDLFDTTGVAAEAGSALLKGRVPDLDAEVLRNATAAGLICLGKTHMTELAFSGLGYNPITASPPCVNDAEAVSGGSSSGAATSVAFGLAAAGIGSDTGGSVRIPAVWNDLVGLKTTSGLLSLEGVVPLAASFDTVGPLCRSVEDAALLLEAMQGGDAVDLNGATVDGARLLLLETSALDDLRDAPAAGFQNAVRRLEAAGAIVERRPVPVVADALALSGVLYATEAYATWKDEIEAAPQKMFDQVLERFRGGAAFSGVEFVQAWQKLRRYRAEWDEVVLGYDAIILPTAANLPPKLARVAAEPDYFIHENLLALRNTRIGNLLGLCALTLPTGVPSTGIMFMGPPMGEARLLRLGHAAEQVLA